MISLGPLQRDNLELYRSWRNDYSVWKWCRQNDFINEVEQVKWFERISQDKYIKMYEIIKNQTPIGVCGLTDFDYLNQRAEFSLYIGPEYHGKGLGKLSLEVLLYHGFTHHNLNLIWGETFEGNKAAKTFESVGMKQDGIRRKFYVREGKFINAILFSILKSEWLSKIEYNLLHGL